MERRQLLGTKHPCMNQRSSRTFVEPFPGRCGNRLCSSGRAGRSHRHTLEGRPCTEGAVGRWESRALILAVSQLRRIPRLLAAHPTSRWGAGLLAGFRDAAAFGSTGPTHHLRRARFRSWGRAARSRPSLFVARSLVASAEAADHRDAVTEREQGHLRTRIGEHVVVEVA